MLVSWPRVYKKMMWDRPTQWKRKNRFLCKEQRSKNISRVIPWPDCSTRSIFIRLVLTITIVGNRKGNSCDHTYFFWYFSMFDFNDKVKKSISQGLSDIFHDGLNVGYYIFILLLPVRLVAMIILLLQLFIYVLSEHLIFLRSIFQFIRWGLMPHELLFHVLLVLEIIINQFNRRI